MKSVKIYISAILAFFAMLCLSVGLLSITPAKATETNIMPTTFSVLDNAGIRLYNNEKGAYGIRFQAYVGDDALDNPIEGATYKMAVVPTELIDLYKKSESQDNIVKWLNDYATSKGGAIATAECTPNAQGLLMITMTDVYWLNLNRDFSAIAYYEVGENVTVANLAEDGNRSIVDVATNFKNSGTATEEEEIILDNFIAEGAQQQENVVVSSETVPEFISTVSGYGDGTVTAATFEDVTAWKINITGGKYLSGNHADVQLNSTLLANRLKGYDTVKFSIYYPSNAGSINFYICEGVGMGGTTANYQFTKGAWNELTFSVSDVLKYNYITIPYARLNADHYVSDIKAYTALEMATPVIEMIDALPTVDNLTPIDNPKITAARSAYDALSDKAKTLVSNYNMLTARESAIAEKFAIVNAMTSTDGFSVSTGYGDASSKSLTVGVDETYGNYLSLSYTNATQHLFLKYQDSITDINTLLSGCDYVYFYVYNNCGKDRWLGENFGGTTSTGSYAKLINGEWTQIKVSVDEFKSGTWFGISSVAGCSGELKISMIWATKTVTE